MVLYVVSGCTLARESCALHAHLHWRYPIRPCVRVCSREVIGRWWNFYIVEVLHIHRLWVVDPGCQLVYWTSAVWLDHQVVRDKGFFIVSQLFRKCGVKFVSVCIREKLLALLELWLFIKKDFFSRKNWLEVFAFVWKQRALLCR